MGGKLGLCFTKKREHEKPNVNGGRLGGKGETTTKVIWSCGWERAGKVGVSLHRREKGGSGVRGGDGGIPMIGGESYE